MGIRLERLCGLVRSGEFQGAAALLQWLRTVDLPWFGNGLCAAYPEYPVESPAPGLAGFRILLAACAKERPRRGGRAGESHHLQAPLRAPGNARHGDLEERSSGVG